MAIFCIAIEVVSQSCYGWVGLCSGRCAEAWRGRPLESHKRGERFKRSSSERPEFSFIADSYGPFDLASLCVAKLKERMLKIETLKKKYDVLCGRMQGAEEDGGTHTCHITC